MKRSKRDTAHEIRSTLAERIERARANYYRVLQDGSLFVDHREGCPLLSSGQPCTPSDVDGRMTGEHCTCVRLFVRDNDDLHAWLETIETAAMVDALARAIESHTSAIPNDDKRNAARERLASFWPFAWSEPYAPTSDVSRALSALSSHEDYSPFGEYGGALPTARPWPAGLAPEALARAIEDAAPNDDKARALALLLRAGIVQRSAEGFPTWPAVESSFPHDVRAALITLGAPVPLVCIARALASIESGAKGRITLPTNAHARTAMQLVSGQRSRDGARIVQQNEGFVFIQYSGNLSRGQLELNLPEPLPNDASVDNTRALQWAFSRLMQREHESALYDFAALLTSTDDVWTWEVHRERTPWGDRVRAGSINDKDALAQVCERFRRWEAAKVWLERCDYKTKQWASVSMHDRPFVWIKGIDGRASRNAPFHRAIIRVNEALFSTGDDGLRAAKPHFATVPRDVLCAPWLDAHELRLALFLPGDMRAALERDAGIIRRSSSWLAELAALPPCSATERDERLRKALAKIEKKGAIERFEIRAGVWTIRPSRVQTEQWFYPRALPPALPPVAMLGDGSDDPTRKTSGAPSTGDDLRAWREARAMTQAQAAGMLGCSMRTIIRAEQRGKDALSRALIRAILDVGATMHAGKGKS